jgi:hypothetical protein
MGKGKTHYEQVPLEIVKKIVEEQGVEVDAGTLEDAVTVPETSNDNSERHHPDPGLKFPKWQKLCQEALIELDPDKLKERVLIAEAGVYVRMQELAQSPDGQEERQALIDVTSSLRYLKRDVLKYPDWEPLAQVQPVPSSM